MTAPPTGDSDREALARVLRGDPRFHGPHLTWDIHTTRVIADAVLAAGFHRPATGDAEVLPGDSAPCGCVLGDEEGPSRPCAAHRAEAIASNARPATGDTLTDTEREALDKATRSTTTPPRPTTGW